MPACPRYLLVVHGQKHQLAQPGRLIDKKPATELLSYWALESNCAVASLEGPRLSPNNVTISPGDTADVAKLAALTTAR